MSGEYGDWLKQGDHEGLWVSSITTARALKHGRHPYMVGFSCLVRKAKTQCEDPMSWARTPVTTPTILSVKRR